MEYIYKYIDKETNIPFYVGRTINLKQRIDQHKNEEKFKNRNSRIEFIQVENRAESEALESHFINLYQTHKEGINISKGGWGTLSMMSDIEFEWIPYGSKVPSYIVSKINYEGKKQYAFYIPEHDDVVWMDERYYSDSFSKVEANRLAKRFNGIVETE